ncbi:hypothetical protein [Mucilaginibacter defluvii]|uniref:DUF1294 domain-containing protein n=1 Tax=Mucilaginibacter defluvii TaxID=1196019 RepID=A0ABP9FPP5_9SPHI
MFKPVLIDGLIAFAVIAVFVFGVDNPKPEWGRLWMHKPLILTQLAGAFGGLVFSLINRLFKSRFTRRIIGIILASVAFIIIHWIGAVLGLNGTMWD